MNKMMANKADKKRTFQEVCDDARRVEKFCLDYINQTKYNKWHEFVFATLWVNLDYEITGEMMQ